MLLCNPPASYALHLGAHEQPAPTADRCVSLRNSKAMNLALGSWVMVAPAPLPRAGRLGVARVVERSLVGEGCARMGESSEASAEARRNTNEAISSQLLALVKVTLPENVLRSSRTHPDATQASLG